MKATPVTVDNADVTSEGPLPCSQCGWPGLGKMPAGVQMLRQNGKNLLIGQLSYYRISGLLCSVCQDLESAVANRPWFVEAHAEYLDQVEVKKQIMGKR